MESPQISEKYCLLSFFYLVFLILTSLRVISGSLELCLAILELGCDQKTVLESTYIYYQLLFPELPKIPCSFNFDSGSFWALLGYFGVGERSKSVLESLHISEKNHFLGFTLSCVFSLDQF